MPLPNSKIHIFGYAYPKTEIPVSINRRNNKEFVLKQKININNIVIKFPIISRSYLGYWINCRTENYGWKLKFPYTWKIITIHALRAFEQGAYQQKA